MSNIDILDVEFLPGVVRYFKSLKRDKVLLDIYRKLIKELQYDPTLGSEKTGDLAGVLSIDLRHNRTNYELAYFVEELGDGRLLLIILAGTRENFYESLKRYIKSSGTDKRIYRE